MLLPLYHVSVATLNTYALWYDQKYVNIPYPTKEFEDMPFKARLVFFTCWCMVLQTLYFTTALVHDIIGASSTSARKTSVIRQLRDTLFAVAFPVAVYVASSFWGIYAIDKDMVFPDRIGKLYPTWVNHVYHTLILVFMLIEIVSTHRPYPPRKLGFAVLLTFNTLYILWMNIVYFKSGVWVYPIFDALGWPLRILFLTGSNGLALLWYVFGENVNNFVWTKRKAHANGDLKSR